eukprot:scaffold5303_cov97-Skeletonema_dohrnii-CCMP3373.AAC.1
MLFIVITKPTLFYRNKSESDTDRTPTPLITRKKKNGRRMGVKKHKQRKRQKKLAAKKNGGLMTKKKQQMQPSTTSSAPSSSTSTPVPSPSPSSSESSTTSSTQPSNTSSTPSATSSTPSTPSSGAPTSSIPNWVFWAGPSSSTSTPVPSPSPTSSSESSTTSSTSSPRFKVGQQVLYSKSGHPLKVATIKEIHLDDNLVPYYLIDINGLEKDTEDKYLSPIDDNLTPSPRVPPSQRASTSATTPSEDSSLDPMTMEFIQGVGCTCSDSKCRSTNATSPNSVCNDNEDGELESASADRLRFTVESVTRSWSAHFVADCSDTVRLLKNMIALRYKADPTQLRLYYNGTPLNDNDASISSYIPSSGITLHVALPLEASGRKRKSELLKQAQARQANQQEQKTAALEKKVNAKAEKPGKHPTKRLMNKFNLDEFNAFYDELCAMAKEVKVDTDTQCPNSGDHVPIYDILQKTNIRKIIREVMAVCKRNDNALIFDRLGTIIQFFSKNDIDIRDFCHNLQERYDADIKDSGVSLFLKRMLLYTIRNEQGCCGKCGQTIEDVIYGAVGYESNHVSDDNATSDEERIKCFNASITAFHGDPVDALFELCKTRLECWRCHNHYGACAYDELPDTCEKTYDFDLVPCFAAQQDDKCKKVLACIKELLLDVATLTFNNVCTTFENNTDFRYKDCFLFNKECWTCADKSTRNILLRRVYLQVEKRMCGGCLQCGEKFCNLPLRELGGIDLHHVIEKKKSFNPSDGADKPFDVSLKENRKLVPLCKKCHLYVHHKPGENDKFMAKLESKYGVDIDQSSGEISAGKKSR